MTCKNKHDYDTFHGFEKIWEESKVDRSLKTREDLKNNFLPRTPKLVFGLKKWMIDFHRAQKTYLRSEDSKEKTKSGY